jgi:glycosyltransferase involved in cell wall biosynthesis
VPEVVADGVSGFVCNSLRDFMDAVPRAAGIDREACHAYAATRFSAAAMADGYEDVYRRMICGCRTDVHSFHAGLSRSYFALPRN